MDFKQIFRRIFHLDEEAQAESKPNFALLKKLLATHPNTAPWLLKKLSRHKCETIVVRVAENPNTAIEVLEELALHSNFEVRMALTENPNTPVRILLALAVDENPDVRYCLAENHSLPLVVLTALLEDENPYVAARATQTLQRLRKSKYRSFAWFPYFRHKGKQAIG